MKIMSSKQSKTELWFGIILIGLAWLSEFGEEANLSIGVRVIRATFITIVLVLAFQINRFLYKKITKGVYKWYVVIIAFLILTTITFFFNSLFIDPYEIMANQKINFIIVIITDMFAAYSILMAMFISWAYSLFERNREVELLNKESELNELKRQLNPHFLFNALSNIYSISYMGDKRTPDKIMQLSEMLRYVIYETDVDFVALHREIEYLEYYIDFQKFKIKKEQKIDFDCSHVNGNLEIAPLLLLPFVENAFKHSQIASEPNAWVNMELKTEGNIIYFFIENTISSKAQPEILNNEGIGLENIKKRLELVYSSKANLTISQGETYRADLKINTK
jgi:LytS/YehU family sensor histidine kinase